VSETGTLECKGCGRPLPAHHAPFIGDERYNLWAREGYCTYLCFRERAPRRLAEIEDELERRREEWMSAAQAAPERVEEARPVEERRIGSVGARILARLADTALGAAAVWGASCLLAGRPLAAGRDGGVEGADQAIDRLLDSALLRSWSDWRAPVAWVLGSVAFFSICHALAGATPAKLLLGMKVAREEAGRPGFGRALVRELLFPVDVAFLGLIAFACMAAGDEKQRLGDFAARTVVVRAAGERRALAGRVFGAAALGLIVWLGVGLAL